MTTHDPTSSVRNEPIVLRQTLLDRETDDQHRSLAHTLRVSKADIIRYCISTGLKDVKEKIGPDWAMWTPEQRDCLRTKLNGTND